jgi:PAS domain S-box-containing protein
MTQVDEGRRVKDAAALNRSLQTLSRCNRVLWQARGEQELLQSICQILVDTAGVRLVWIGYCEDDAEKTVHPVASAGNGLGYLERVKISWGNSDAGQGPADDAIRTGKFCWIDDIRTDPKSSHWRTEAMARGYVSCVAFPLVAEAGAQGLLDLRGTLTLYADAFDKSDIERYADLASYLTCAVARLRSNLAEDVSYGVTALRTRADRKRAEEALRERADLLDLTHDTIFVRDANNIITYWNRGAEELYGWKREEAVGKVCHQLTQTIFPEPLEDIMEKLLRTSRWEGELIHAKRDGTKVIVASRWSAQRDERGRFVGTLETNNDTTERKRAEGALRRSEAQLAEAQRLSLTGSFTWNHFSNERHWSDETYRLLEYSPGLNPTSELFLQRVHPEDREFVQQTLNDALRNGTSFDIEHRLLMPDGSIKYLHTVSHATKNEAGYAEVVGATTDITATKRAIEELQQTQTELARLTRLTTMGQLAASIAHEINQPLTGIVTNGNTCLHWLADETLNLAKARMAAQRIVRDGARASDVIGRIRGLMTKSAPQIVDIDLNDVINEVLAFTQTELRMRKVSARTELATMLPLVLGDRVQLQQVILNLVINGIEAMSAVTDRPRILLIGSHLDTEGRALIFLRDHGSGLDPETIDKLFEPFFTTKSEGIGMGLAICRSIIEAHGGRLWAAGANPHGAVFQFTLPITTAKRS